MEGDVFEDYEARALNSEVCRERSSKLQGASCGPLGFCLEDPLGKS